MKKPDVLRAFPETPGSIIWVVQNMTKGTEYRCHLEEMWCTCGQYEHKHRCSKHLDFALRAARIALGTETEAEFLKRMEHTWRSSQ